MIHLEFLVFAGFIFTMIVFIVSCIISKSALTSCCISGFLMDAIVFLVLVVFILAEPDFYSTEVLKSVQPVSAVTIEDEVVSYINLQDGQRYSTADFSTVESNSSTMNEYVITKYRGIGFVICNVHKIETVRRFE